MKTRKTFLCFIMVIILVLLTGLSAFASETRDPAVEEELLLEEAPGQDTEFPAEEEIDPETETLPEEDPEPEMEAEAGRAGLLEAPETPELLSAGSTKDGVLIKWKPVEHADSYLVYRWNASLKVWKKMGAASDCTYLDKTLAGGGKRYYTVAAVSGEETGAYDETGITGVYIPAVTPSVKMKNNEAVLSWTAAAGAETYKVLRRLKGEKSWTVLAETAETGFTDKAIRSGTFYEYAVRGTLVFKNKTYLGYLGGSVVSSLDIPAAPAVSKAASNKTGIRVSWKAVSGCQEYRIYRKTGSEKWKKIAAATSPYYQDNTASPGVLYSYSVTAYNASDNESLFDNTGKTGVYVPRTEITSIANETGIKLAWKASEGANKYRIYRKSPGAKWVQVATISGTAYEDTQTVSGKKYAYVIRPLKRIHKKNYIGDYDPDAQALILKLDRPSVKAAPALGKKIVISWKAVPGASAYYIYRFNDASSEWEKVRSSKTTSCTFSNAETGKMYTYTVAAKKGGYMSAYDKNGVSVAYLDPPVMKSAVSTENGILVKWDPAEKAEGYKILRKIPGGKWKTVGSSKTTSFTDGTVTTGIKYRYIVKAYVRSGGRTCCGPCDTSQAIRRYFKPPVSEARRLAKAKLEETGGTLKGAYDWAVKIPYSSAQPASDSSEGYARWSFKQEKGDCLGKAAVFCLMARELGYKADLIYGSVPLRAGGFGEHGWVEIEYDGTTYVCDPDFEYEAKRNGYFINYGQSGTWMYQKDHIIP